MRPRSLLTGPMPRMPAKRRCAGAGCFAALSIGLGVFGGVSPRQHKRNRFFRRIRVAVERVIGTLKRHYGIERLPYVGQARNWCHLLLVSMCYNLKRMLVLQASR